MIQLDDDSPTRRKKVASMKTEDSTSDLISKKAYHKLQVFERLGIFQKIFGEVFVPLFLMISVPITTMTLWYICRYKNGSISEFIATDLPFKDLMYDVLFNQWHGSLFSIYIITGIS